MGRCTRKLWQSFDRAFRGGRAARGTTRDVAFTRRSSMNGRGGPPSVTELLRHGVPYCEPRHRGYSLSQQTDANRVFIAGTHRPFTFSLIPTNSRDSSGNIYIPRTIRRRRIRRIPQSKSIEEIKCKSNRIEEIEEYFYQENVEKERIILRKCSENISTKIE